MTNMPRQHRAAPLATALALAFLLAACAGMLPGGGAPPDLYTLTPKSTYSADLPTVTWQLAIEVPVAAESLNNSRIALRHDPLSLLYYKGARWTERAPVMVQTLLVESFENSGKIVAVARKATDIRADYVLKTDLREFQAEYDAGGAPVAHVRLNAKMVVMPKRAIIASETFESSVRAEGSNISQVIVAFDTALGKTLKQIVEWGLTVPK